MNGLSVPTAPDPGSHFGLDNLPLGVFSTGRSAARCGVRYGDQVIDLSVLLDDNVFAAPSLNGFLARGPQAWRRTREAIADLIVQPVPHDAVHPVKDVRMQLPIEVADYVDFYACEHHAANVGRLFRPGAEPLTPNWKYLPIGYHGRAGTVVVSGTDITRPYGQRKVPEESGPTFGPTERLDIEVELGFVVGAGSVLGQPISIDEFDAHVFGAVLLNDWSARDIQAWEYVPLGPMLGKSFGTSISPWVVPLAALDSARIPLPTQVPEPLEYLRGIENHGLDVNFEVRWNGELVSRPSYRDMYFSPAQMLAHMTVNGASARTGDLFGSGTVSGAEKAEWGSFLELSWGGRDPIRVNGELRTFLADGDRVVITATAPGRGGGRIGFGEVAGRVVPRGFPSS